jgi:hypothetical protein
MRALAAGIALSSICLAPLLAQERDRSLERIDLATQQPSAIVTSVVPVERDLPKKLGMFTLVSPALRGEMVRVSVPVGEYVTRALTSVAASKHRRQEAAARRRVEASLKRFAEQQQQQPKQ